MGANKQSMYDYLDQIDDILDEGSGSPDLKDTMINDIRNVLDEMRLDMPYELTMAKSIVNQHDKVISMAEDKAKAILDGIEKENNYMISLTKLIEVMMQYFNDVHYSEHAVKVYAYTHNIDLGEKLSAEDNVERVA